MLSWKRHNLVWDSWTLIEPNCLNLILNKMQAASSPLPCMQISWKDMILFCVLNLPFTEHILLCSFYFNFCFCNYSYVRRAVEVDLTIKVKMEINGYLKADWTITFTFFPYLIWGFCNCWVSNPPSHSRTPIWQSNRNADPLFLSIT